MTTDTPESDWKVLKQLHDVALDRLCRRLLAEVEGIAADATRTPHQRYLALYQAAEILPAGPRSPPLKR